MRNRSILLFCSLFLRISASQSLGETADLALHVETHKNTCVLGEPLFITARVRNESTEPVKVARQNSPGYDIWSKNPFAVLISVDGNSYYWWSDGFRKIRDTIPIELAPGAEFAADLVIMFDRYGGLSLEQPAPGVDGQVRTHRNQTGFAFERPGDYWISIKVKLSHTDVPSFQAAPIKVTVTPPGTDSLEAWRVLGSEKFAKKYGELIQIPWYAKLSTEDLQQFDDIIKRYPRSIYTEYVALCMGRWYLEGRNRDKSQARRYLEMAKSMASSDFVKAKAMKALEGK